MPTTPLENETNTSAGPSTWQSFKQISAIEICLMLVPIAVAAVLLFARTR